MKKYKVCKSGSGIAIGFNGCGRTLPVALNNKPNFKYGLGISCKCYSDWLLNSDEGAEKLKKSIIVGKKKSDVKIKKERRAEKSELNTSSTMGLADMYFSRYIRLKHSEDGYCTCYTCGTIKPIKEVENGHYMKRVHKAVRFDENNTRPQCKICNGNTLHNGKQVEFRINLVNEVGLQEVERIEQLTKVNGNFNAKFYRDKADYYRNKVNELQKELGIKYW